MTIDEKEISAQALSPDDISGGQYSGFEILYGFLLLFLLLMVLANSSFFEVRNVQVIGNETFTKPEIMTASQLDAQQTLFQIALNKSQIQRNLLRKARIASCVVELRFPNQVTIIVKERKPLCLLKSRKNLLLVSNDGIILGTGAQGDNALPVITGISIRNPAVGGKIHDSKMQTALTIMHEADVTILRDFQEIDLRNQLLVLDFPDTHHMIKVELGSSDNITTKMANLRAIISHTDVNLLEKIDLRVAELPSIIKANGNAGISSPPAVIH